MSMCVSTNLSNAVSALPTSLFLVLYFPVSTDVKDPELDDHFTSSAEVKNVQNITSTSQYVLMHHI
jgi:hypothetical protein